MELIPENELKKTREHFSNLINDQHVEMLEVVTTGQPLESETTPIKYEDLEGLKEIDEPIENILIFPDGAELIDKD